MLQKIYTEIDEHYQEMVDIRRYLHQHPELSFEETETSKYIADYYKNLHIPFEQNIGGNGIIATLKGGKPGKIIALRADFDALPIQEENMLDYKSQNNGVMHACGHDGHTATLLVLAKVLQANQSTLEGTVVFVHQHAEEQPPGGAKPIIDSGKLDHVDAVFGSHLWATTELGTVETRKGVFMAGTDRFEITIKGKGGHGAYPHETKDAIVIGAEVVTKLQTIISRSLDPLKTAVITIGQFDAGKSFNVIADEAKLIGTVRYLEPEVQTLVKHRMKQAIKGICDANDADCDIQYIEGYPPVVNHPEETDIVLNTAKELEEVKHAVFVEPQMGGKISPTIYSINQVHSFSPVLKSKVMNIRTITLNLI